MASGFVSGGTADAPVERNDEWLEAQREIEANRLKKAEAMRESQTGGRSLFETLEANKGISCILGAAPEVAVTFAIPSYFPG